MKLAVLLGFCAALAAGHMSMIIPVPRNAVDRHLPGWANGTWYVICSSPWYPSLAAAQASITHVLLRLNNRFPYAPDCTNCTTTTCVTNPRAKGWNPQIPSGCIPPGTDGWACNCANGTSQCSSGQSCFWFS